jgi:hypothetical protein
MCAELRDPEGTVIAGPACSTNLDFTAIGPLTKNGVYQLVVTEQFNDQTVSHTLSLQCIAGACGPRPPNCIVEPSLADRNLTLTFTLGTPEQALWHVSLAAVGRTIPLWTTPIGPLEPPATHPVTIPNVPNLGRVGLLSTLTTNVGLICADFKTIDSGPASPGGKMPTPEELERLVGNIRPQ